ncbi:MAG: SpoIIE family protein phosphatase [Bacteroidetes bacterium]|nr:SpoIIE family protein phosphatase [Bacteroidota bacterium]
MNISNIWTYSENDTTITHLLQSGREDIYKTSLSSYFAPDLDYKGSFILADSQTVKYLLGNKISIFPLDKKSKSINIFSGNSGEIYLNTVDDRILVWNPLKNSAPSEISGIPTGKINTIGQTGKIVYFQKGRQTGWIQDGKLFLLDTLRYPKHAQDDLIFQDNNNRIYLSGNKNANFIKEILVYQKGNFIAYPLPDSVPTNTFDIADCLNESDELIYFTDTKIYRYNKEIGNFYFIKNLGENFGYIWSAKVIGKKLYLTGWSSVMVTIDLNSCPLTFPALSFSAITNNTKELDIDSDYTINNGDIFIVNYIAIEKFNQSKIVYQTRILGRDSLWSLSTKNEIKEFTNIPAGTYRFEVRSKGDSEVWSPEIGFNFVVRPPWYSSTIAYVCYVILFSLFIWSILRLNAHRLKLANNALQIKISNATSEILKQKKVVEEKNHEILDSITYATRIQATILPPLRVVKKYLNDSFVLYLPKDIVAGDFYWMETPGADDTLFFAVCDCTGHGVPGAMVSVVCHNALNRTVREFFITQPAQILDKVTELVVQAFSLNNADNDEIKDGMDASLCALNTTTGHLQWAGANNPLWVVKLNGELVEYKANKQSIGKSSHIVPFTNQSIQLEKGDILYLFTDGYADQFGGELNKKFQRKSLKELLSSIHSKSMEEQREIIFMTFENWRGKNEQTDDVCIIGIRI